MSQMVTAIALASAVLSTVGCRADRDAGPADAPDPLTLVRGTPVLQGFWGQSRVGTLTFRNATTDAVTVAGVTTSCTCTTARLAESARATVAAGGEIELQVRASLTRGVHGAQVMLEAGDGSILGRCKLELRGRNSIVASPEVVELGDVPVGVATSVECTLTSLDGRSPRLLDVADGWSRSSVHDVAGLRVRRPWTPTERGYFDHVLLIPVTAASPVQIRVRGFGVPEKRQARWSEVVHLGAVRGGSTTAHSWNRPEGFRNESVEVEVFKTPGSHGELRLDRSADPWRIELVTAEAERGVISSRLFVVGGDGAVAQVQVSGVVL